MQQKLIIFFLLSLIYFCTIDKGLTPEDSGELASAVYSIGIPHPPGYPLYVLTAKLWTFIFPFKNIIFRLNIFSSLFAIITCLILYEIIFSILKNKKLAIIFSLIFGVSRTFWACSIVTELYSFNMFLVSLFILFTFKILKNQSYSKFYFFLTGILMISHYSNFLIIIPCYFIIYKKYKKSIFKLINFGFLILPLSLFLVLLIRSKSEPFINWGNPKNINNLLFHIMRLSLGPIVNTGKRSFALFIEQLKLFLKMFYLQFGILNSVILSIFAIYSIFKFPNEFKKLFAFLLILNSLGVILLLNFKTDEEGLWINIPFFLQFFMIFIITASYGISFIKRFNFFITFLILILTFLNNYRYNNRSGYNWTLQYNKNLLKSASYRGIIFLAKDFITFPILYLQNVEYLRPDLKFYDWFGNVFEDIFKRKDFHLLPEFKREAIRESVSDKIRMTNKNETYYAFQRSTLDNMKSLGLIYTFNKNHPDFDLNYYDFDNVEEEDIKYLDYFIKNMISVYYFHLGYYYFQLNDKRSEYYFNFSDKFGGSRGKHYYNLAINEIKRQNLESAIFYLKRAITDEPQLERAYFVLGNIYFQQGNFIEAEKMYIKVISLNRLNGPAYNNLANLYLKFGQKERAIEILKEGVSTGYGKIFNNLALIYSRDGDLKLAYDYLKKGIEVSGEDIELYINMSVILSKMGRWEEAGNWLEKGLKLEPYNEKILLNLGLVHLKLGNLDKALKILKIGAEKYPENKEFKKYLKLIESNKY